MCFPCRTRVPKLNTSYHTGCLGPFSFYWIDVVLEFNPYRKWLGIDSKSKPTYYQLLGILINESDTERVKLQAKRQIQRLLSVDANEHALLRDEIIKRVKCAAKCLIDKDQRRKYDQWLLHAPHATQEQNTHRVYEDVPTQNLPEAKERVADGGGNFCRENSRLTMDEAAVSQQIVEQPWQISDVFAPGKYTGKRGIARMLKKKNQRFNVVLSSILLGGVSVLGVGYLLATQTSLLSGVLDSSRSRATRIAPATAGDDQDGPVSKRLADSETFPDLIRVVADDSDDNTSLEQAPTVSAPESFIPPTAEHLRELGRLLTEVRARLTEGKIDEARALLAIAAPLARRPQDKAKHQRLAMLTDYVAGYWSAARDGLRQFESGEELELNGTRVIVVENNSDALILRMDGQNKTYPIHELPFGLRTFFADRWLDSSAATTKVFRGAMMAVSPEFEKEEIRQLWRRAQQSRDVHLGDLELVLEDTYDLAP